MPQSCFAPLAPFFVVVVVVVVVVVNLRFLVFRKVVELKCLERGLTQATKRKGTYFFPKNQKKNTRGRAEKKKKREEKREVSLAKNSAVVTSTTYVVSKYAIRR